MVGLPWWGILRPGIQLEMEKWAVGPAGRWTTSRPDARLALVSRIIAHSLSLY